jgi:hypothetical protein
LDQSCTYIADIARQVSERIEVAKCSAYVSEILNVFPQTHAGGIKKIRQLLGAGKAILKTLQRLGHFVSNAMGSEKYVWQALIV